MEKKSLLFVDYHCDGIRAVYADDTAQSSGDSITVTLSFVTICNGPLLKLLLGPIHESIGKTNNIRSSLIKFNRPAVKFSCCDLPPSLLYCHPHSNGRSKIANVNVRITLLLNVIIYQLHSKKVDSALLTVCLSSVFSVDKVINIDNFISMKYV